MRFALLPAPRHKKAKAAHGKSLRTLGQRLGRQRAAPRGAHTGVHVITTHVLSRKRAPALMATPMAQKHTACMQTTRIDLCGALAVITANTKTRCSAAVCLHAGFDMILMATWMAGVSGCRQAPKSVCGEGGIDLLLIR